jgi:phosphate transport system substrate-binding protein
VEDTHTSGRITGVCTTEGWQMIARERDAFIRAYPDARIDLQPGSSREALRALYAAETDLAVISRELSVDERAAAVRGGLELEGYRFARDAVVLIVNPDNPIENVSLEDVRDIYAAPERRWSVLGGPDRVVVPVFQPVESDIVEFFGDEVMGDAPFAAPAVPAASDSEVVQKVLEHRDAIGFVSLAWADRGAKVLRVASARGMPYWKPDPEAVYRGEYPLTRFFNFYMRTRGRRLAGGFITFVTSRDGQKIVHESGLVPTSVPVRFVRRSPMQSSH